MVLGERTSEPVAGMLFWCKGENGGKFMSSDRTTGRQSLSFHNMVSCCGIPGIQGKLKIFHEARI